VRAQIDRLIQAGDAFQAERIRSVLKEIVPEYAPAPSGPGA